MAASPPQGARAAAASSTTRADSSGTRRSRAAVRSPQTAHRCARAAARTTGNSSSATMLPRSRATSPTSARRDGHAAVRARSEQGLPTALTHGLAVTAAQASVRTGTGRTTAETKFYIMLFLMVNTWAVVSVKRRRLFVFHPIAPPPFRSLGKGAWRNGPFRAAKRPVSCCGMGHFALRFGLFCNAL